MRLNAGHRRSIRAAARGVQSVVKSVAGLGDTADRIAFPVERFQALSFAAEQTGTDVRQPTDGLSRPPARCQVWQPHEIAAFLALLVVLKHAGNIRRLVKGEESRITFRDG